MNNSVLSFNFNQNQIDFIFFDNNHPEVTAEWLESLKKVCDQITADDLMLSEDGGIL
mgnify:CR=1 FL=1